MSPAAELRGERSLTPDLSGCTTYLKTIAGEMNGIYLDDKSQINYRGITKQEMESQFRGEASYTAEVDVHFPILTVGQTLASVDLPPLKKSTQVIALSSSGSRPKLDHLPIRLPA